MCRCRASTVSPPRSSFANGTRGRRFSNHFFDRPRNQLTFRLVEAYKLGAVDYLTKPLVPEILQAKVAGFVELLQRSEIIKQQASELEANQRQQRLQVEAALRDSEERHRVRVQAVKDFAIFHMDSGGRVTSWNEGGERLTGYTMEDAIGKHLRTFFTLEDQAAKKPERELQRATRDRGTRVGRELDCPQRGQPVLGERVHDGACADWLRAVSVVS